MAATKETAQVDVIINGTKATSTIKEMNAAVRVLNTQIANLTPGTQEFIDKVAELQRVQAKLKDTRDSVKGVSDETKGLSDRMTKLDGGGGVFSRLKTSFSETKESVLGATNGLSGFQIGLFGVIGAVAALIGYSLYSYFTKTDEGATKLEGIIGGLKAAMDRLVAGFVSAGEWIVNAFSKPKEALEDIVNFLKSQVEVRIQAVVRMFQALGTILSGELRQGLADLNNAQIDLATGVENTTGKIVEFADEVARAAKVAYDLALATDALEDAEQRYSITAAKREVLVDRLLLQAKNATETEKDRIALLDAASLVEIADYNEKNRLAQEALKLAKDKTNEALRSIGVTKEEIEQANTLQKRLDLIQRLSGDLPQKEVDALNKITALEGESLKVQEKIVNRRAALEEELGKIRQKKADEELKRQEKHAKDVEKFTAEELAFYRKTQDLQIVQIENTYEQKREAARVAAQRELEDTKVFGAEKEILESSLQVKLNETLAQIDREEKEKRLKESLENEALYAQTQEASMALQFAGQLDSERDQTEALYQIRLEAALKELELLQLSGVAEPNEIQKKENAITLLKADAEKRRTEDARKSSEERKRIQALELQGAKQATEGVMNLIEEVAGENAKATVAYKAFATADAVINGVLEIQRIWAQYGGIPGGQIIAGVLTGVSAARTAIAVSKINSVQASKPKFARGGVISEGSLHSQGGIAMIDRRTGLEVGEMERNETILTGGVKANPTLLREASRINVLGGGRAFYADGGTLDAQLPSQQSNIDFSLYLQEARRTNELLQAFPTSLKAYTVLTDFEDKQTLQDNIKSNANA